ncbi:MAG: hypothetical protein WEA10_02935 [Actinomycetota bacterium]
MRGSESRRGIGAVAWAAIWYPLGCVAVAAAVGVWFYADCGNAADTVACRESIVPGSLLFLAVILGAGIVVLAIVWAISLVVVRLLDAGPADPRDRSEPGGQRPGVDDALATRPPASTVDPTEVTASRAKRHEHR